MNKKVLKVLQSRNPNRYFPIRKQLDANGLTYYRVSFFGNTAFSSDFHECSLMRCGVIKGLRLAWELSEGGDKSK